MSEPTAYVPPALAELLVVGRRVRIRLSKECPIHLHDWERDHDGDTGSLFEPHPDVAFMKQTSHPYAVNFGERFDNGFFAAAELIPLDDAGEEIKP